MAKPRYKPISQEYARLMEQPFPGDPLHRTGAKLLTQRVFKSAMEGNLAAAVEIANRVEGKADQSIDVVVEDSAADVYDRLRLMVRKFRGELPEHVIEGEEAHSGREGQVTE